MMPQARSESPQPPEEGGHSARQSLRLSRRLRRNRAPLRWRSPEQSLRGRPKQAGSSAKQSG
jgi:hypothetical protein